MPRPDLTPEQQADADRIHAALVTAAAADLRGLADLLATKTDRDLFGATEFQVRDLALAIAAKALQAAADGRKKRATTAPAGPAPVATTTPGSTAGSPGGW